MLKSDNCLDILKLLIIHNPDLIKNDNLLLSYVENNMYECILELLNNGITYDNVLDGSNNTILHLLCKKRVKSDIISQIFRKTIKIIDKQNDKLMTPIMIASIEGNEDLFWLLKGFNPNMDLTDIYGNTVYHYVCRSRICPSMSIINSKNKFGYTPKDYLQINPNFYYFI
jgi:ankyrin repeat protein